jgi:hypothetical protein
LKRGVLNWKMGFGKLIGVWCLEIGGYYGLWSTRRDWATSVVVLSIGWTSLFAVLLICHPIPHRSTYVSEEDSAITDVDISSTPKTSESENGKRRLRS